MPTLDELGKELKLDQSSLKHDYLNTYDSHFSKELKENIVIVGDSQLAFIESCLFSDYYANKTIYFVTRDNFSPEIIRKNLIIKKYTSYQDLVFYLFSITKINCIIEHSYNGRENKSSLFCFLFPLLEPNGGYFVEDLQSFSMEVFNDDNKTILDYLSDAWIEKYKPSPNLVKIIDAFLPELIINYTNFGKLLLVNRSSVSIYKKIQQYFSNDAFKYNRYLYNEVLVYRNAQIIKNPSLVRTNIPNYLDSMPKKLKIPPIILRDYDDVICIPGSIVLKEGFLLPEYQRRTLKPNHHNRYINRETKYYVANFSSYKNTPPDNIVKGDCLYLDNEYDQHFGHTTLEQISKLWAWDVFIDKYKDGKILVAAKSGTIYPLLLDILLKYGVPEDRIIPINKPVRVEHLVCPTQLYEITHFCSPLILDTWNRLRKIYEPLSTLQTLPRKIFLTRRASNLPRHCTNTDVVEKIFSDHGYSIFEPELLSYPDQVALFAHAEKIGAFGGSNSLNAIYSQMGINKTIIKSETYDANNDFLISSVKGDNLNICFCPSKIHHGSHWIEKAFMSPFSFDVKRDSDYLHSVI